MTELSDPLTEAVTYRRKEMWPDGPWIVDADSPDESGVLREHVGLATWDVVEHIMVPQILIRAGFAVNDSGISYHPTEEEDPSLEPYLTVFNPIGRVDLSVHGYERFMLRFFRFIIADALKHGDPETRSSWWPGDDRRRRRTRPRAGG